MLRAVDGDVRRVVLLGDAVELRHGPVSEALAAAAPFFRALGERLGADGEIVLVPGNHDHELIAPWLERERVAGRLTALEARPPVDASDATGMLAEWAAPATLTFAYPGIRLRPDVFAMHGHYLDVHFSLPTFERLAVGVMERLVGEVPGDEASPDDYERALTPVYAWLYALAQSQPPGTGATPGASTSVAVWRALADGRGAPLRRNILRLAFPLAVAGINRAGIGPVGRDLSSDSLRQAGLHAVHEVLRRIGVRDGWALFGHTHRAGPFPGDDLAEWEPPGAARVMNTGSWLYAAHFLTRSPNRSPYWPGTCVVVPDAVGEPPELRRLLGYRGHADLRPDPR